MKLNEVIAALPKLTQHELLTVRAALEQLITAPHAEDVDVTSPLYDNMSRLLGVTLSFRDFHNTAVYRQWKRNAPACIAYLDKHFPDSRKATKSALMLLMLESLIEDLKDRGVPITLGTVTKNIDRLPQMFDLIFPGYLESGLGHVIVQQLEGGKRGRPDRSDE